ncbi:MAG TPA: DEAD/DEAH box helicase [Candidatus Dormibacteraeota bacterium]|nr:DEAD/DEAH box helicase [Candidatus Dormibacteraeota bacterium]
MRGVAKLGFTLPTPIQAQAIPAALAGRDVLASAMTGSGKTLAFGLPVLNAILQQPRGKTRALILAPTRELAVQIRDSLVAAAKLTPLRIAAVYGGVGMANQELAFKKNVDVIVATPGRLLDHLNRPYGKLDGIEHLVLDEADRMLDMGFLPAIRRVLARLPKQRQNLCFSATIPPEIASLLAEILVDPVRVELARKAAPATGITQSVYHVAQDGKSRLLLELLKDNGIFSIIAFTRTKSRADRLAKVLATNGVPAERIHGDRSQAQRVRALTGFKEGKYRVLVATDIAARGIDISTLSHVLNFDVPSVPDDYIHRVGRTGRAELEGDAITFVAPDEERSLRDIERALGKKLPRKRVEGFEPALAASAAPAPQARRRGPAPRTGRASARA